MIPHSVQNTPVRERNPTYRSDASTSQYASPSSSRVAQPPNPTSRAPVQPPISVPTLLTNHANASDPKMAALETAVSDRNHMSGQNAQLWKLIEKQRSGYSHLMKELERVRGERDTYRGRLQVLGENTDALLKAHREREKREGREGSLRSAASHTHLRGAEGGGANANGVQDPRSLFVRTQSDDIASQAQLGSSTPPDQSFSRSPARERQGSLNSLHASTSAAQLSNSYLSSSHASSSTRLAVSPSDSSTSLANQYPIPSPVADLRRPPLNPLRASSLPASDEHTYSPVGARSTTLPTPTSSRPPAQPSPSIPSSRSDIPVPATAVPSQDPQTQTQRKSNEDSEASSRSDRSEPMSPKSAVPPSARLDPRSQPQPQVIVQSASGSDVEPQMSDSSMSNTNGLVAPLRPPTLPRDSHVSIPEEAKRYYAAMGQSPAPSPVTSHGFQYPSAHSSTPDKLSPIIQQRRTDSPLSSDTPSSSGADQESNTNEEYRGGATTAKDNAEFLDLEASDTEYSINDSGRASAVDSVDQDSESMQSRAEDGLGGRPKRAAVEDFPLPPTTPPAVESFAQAQLQRQQSLRSASIATSETLVTSDTASQSTHANGSVDARGASPQYAPPSSASQNYPPPVIPLMAFRALPLLASDLPQTTIQVSHSSIRPNERGKDVLSFVIIVNPGNGKPSWKIEKLYSDVLTLDARVRATLGKTLSKKLVALPEGRLWRDHAPAKVDQRKAALEQYLRSLIALPTKNKDEIVAFFTSGIANEAQKPVTRAGYKEGYLTKRGKNFGGWKTRYFMLQGPTLEYYESRGGAHLGSILITGAQIGRQQRMPDRKETDEENEYRHAFLIIEAKKGPGGSNPRHVLCAESDMERDSWVEVLVRYVSGRYSEEEVAGSIDSGSRTSISSTAETAVTPTRRPRKDEIAKGPAVPIAQLAPDAANAKLFQAAPPPEEASQSPIKSANPLNQVVQSAKEETPLSSSLPVSSPLAADDTDPFANVGQRANSEMGHYPDLVDQRAVLKNRPTTASPEQRRKDKRRSINPLKTSPIPERPPTPDRDAALNTPRVDVNGKVKISGPMNGTPIPAGYKFGGKDAPPEQPSQSDRREKAKSRSFWGFGRQIHDKPNVPVHVPRAVFGVALEESLDVAEIASLPAIVFRCIQYLEAKKAEQEEGIYRLSGSSAVIKALKDRFNNEGDVDLLGSDEYWDPHAIAGLLKTFLRELPASILTRDLHLRFLSVIDFVDPQERIAELSQLIASLPIANYSLLRALTAHLILIVQNANVNKMTMRNVGIVFSPTLGIPAGVFSLMLGEFKRVFNVDGTLDEEDPPAPEGQSTEASDFSRRNSKRYSDAAADQLLGLSGRTLSKEEAQSDEGEEYSVHDESGTEETGEADNESTVESSATHSSAHVPPPHPPANQTGDFLHPSDYSGSTSATGGPKVSRASHVAASRGLNITTATDKASRRQSRMVVGLPHSPRPAHNSPHSPHTPQRVPASPGIVPPSPLQQASQPSQ